MKKVIYKINNKGEFPNKYLKSFVPSKYFITEKYFAGETNVILDEFDMIEISEEEYKMLSLLHVEDGKYSKFNSEGDVQTKTIITLSDEEKKNQIYILKKICKIIIKDKIDEELNELYKEFSTEERNTWTLQKTEAENYLKTNDINTAPFISKLAEERKIPLIEFANKILNKANQMKEKQIAILSKYQNMRKIVKDSNDFKIIKEIFEKIK